MIKKVTHTDDFEILADLQRKAHATVAIEFGLTKQNCPAHNAFITAIELKSKLDEHREFYFYALDKKPVAFIGIERSLKNKGTFYIEKVATLPGYRHQGIGTKLMNFVTRRIVEAGGNKASVGLIDANTKLKKWYQSFGFIETGIKSFPHLPFSVCFMEKVLV